MAYTDIDKPSDYFNTVLWTGNGSGATISGVGFQPDWVWEKSRSANYNHNLIDSVRGANKVLESNNDEKQATKDNTLMAFNSDGFVHGNNAGWANDGSTFVAWNWKAGTALNNSAGANGGSIATTGSISTTSGFGIVQHEGSGSNATIYHGLGKIPKLIITKNIDQNFHWSVYSFTSNTTILRLNGINTPACETAFQSTHPTATVQSLGDHNQNNGSGDAHISYMFCDVQGYQKVGLYTGGGSVFPFIFTGFKPAFTLFKNISSNSEWFLYDNKRPGFNRIRSVFEANSNSIEDSSSDTSIDYLSNGFKIRTANGNVNTDGDIYIYLAIAENPFVTSTGVPATAR